MRLRAEPDAGRRGGSADGGRPQGVHVHRRALVPGGLGHQQAAGVFQVGRQGGRRGVRVAALDVRAEHEPVVAAVERGDAEAAAAALTAHLEHTGRLLVAQAARAQGRPVDVAALWADVVG